MCKGTMGDVQLYTCGMLKNEPVVTTEEDVEHSQPFWAKH